jgi:putative oxidoreductase
MYKIHDLGLLILRIGLSSLMITHGLGKIQRFFADEIKFVNLFGIGKEISLLLAVLGEFIAPILIIIGYKTRFFTIFPSVTMFVAAFIIHNEDAFAKKEKALLFLIGFLSILFLGPGRISIDHRKNNKLY